jgi:colanic acid biosynthesis glycosyl transferase WcaI
MRIVLLNQFYPPDLAPTGRYLHDLAQALVARGHSVSVLASRHAYAGGGDYPARELVDGVDVLRMPGFAFGRARHAGKLADYAAYYARLASELLRMQPADLIVALTTPPFVGTLAALAARAGKARHAHWLMDLYPDVMEAHGLVGGPALAALRQVARASFAGAGAIITLGPAMAAKARTYAQKQTTVEWVPLWSPESLHPWPADQSVPLRHERGWDRDRLVLLYSGNFGLGHRFGEFLDAARALGSSGPIWSFAGTGRNRIQVERFAARHPELPIVVTPYVPEQRLREHLCSADVHLVSMDARWEGTLLPSKLQASFAVGKPVIFVGDARQDIARWIADADAGWIVPENEPQALLDAIGSAGDSRERARRGANASAYASAHFDRATNLAALVRACESAVSSPPAVRGRGLRIGRR